MGAMRYLGLFEVKGLLLCDYWVDEFFDLTGSAAQPATEPSNFGNGKILYSQKGQ